MLPSSGGLHGLVQPGSSIEDVKVPCIAGLVRGAEAKRWHWRVAVGSFICRSRPWPHE